ncbi:MAG: PhoH family protein, partial [Neisseria sp.]
MTHTVHLQFEDIDNTVLQRLCGALDGNLEALGKALDIQISRRFE